MAGHATFSKFIFKPSGWREKVKPSSLAIPSEASYLHPCRSILRISAAGLQQNHKARSDE
jgi:hypothetical protein